MRAGHSMTLVDTKLYIIGGSYGQDYLKDVYELDTDPMPEWEDIEVMKGPSMLSSGIAALMNQPDFADVTFIVEGKPFYAHKNIIQILSEKYRAMFKTGMQESQGNKTIVKIDHISYPVFQLIMQYLYSGQFNPPAQYLQSIDMMVDILRVADEEFLDEVSQNPPP